MVRILPSLFPGGAEGGLQLAPLLPQLPLAGKRGNFYLFIMTARLLLGMTATPPSAQAGKSRGLLQSKNDGCDCSKRPNLKDPSTFGQELTKLIQNDTEAQAANAMRRQISRAIRRATGLKVGDQVSEEQLFAGVAGHEVLQTTDRRTYIAFSERVRQLSRSRESGRSTEDAVKIALKELVDRRVLSQSTANTIYSRAFAASQLDDNDCALFDGTGGGRDHSNATTDFRSALVAGTLGLTQTQGGQLEVMRRSIKERGVGHRFSPAELIRTSRSKLGAA
jgi:hypothetical protein